LDIDGKSIAEAVQQINKWGVDLLKLDIVNGRFPINSKRWAGQTHPSGVKFNEKGYPDFSPFAKKSVKVEGLNGDYKHDEKLALKKLKMDETDKGYVWHHVEDSETMIMIPKSIHDAVRHTGGAAKIKEAIRIAAEKGMIFSIIALNRLDYEFLMFRAAAEKQYGPIQRIDIVNGQEEWLMKTGVRVVPKTSMDEQMEQLMPTSGPTIF
jgi:hypothetical protein